MKYSGQCSHGMPLGKRCVKCDESPMADFTTVKVKNRELQAGVEELTTALARAETAERERDNLLKELVKVFNWTDTGYVHALLHIHNAVDNLRCDLSVAEQERDAALKLLSERDRATQRQADRLDLLDREYYERRSNDYWGRGEMGG